MARRNKSKAKNDIPTFGKKEGRPRPLFGLLFLIIALLSALSIWDYEWTQNPELTTEIFSHNMIGIAGVKIAYTSLRFLGVGAWLLPIFSFWLALMLFLAQARKLHIGRFVALFGVFLCTPVLLSLWQVREIAGVGYTAAVDLVVADNYYPNGLGGWVGDTLYRGFLHENLGQVGTMVVFGLLLLASLVYVLYDNVGRSFEGAFARIREWYRIKREQAAVEKERKAKEAARKAAVARANAVLEDAQKEDSSAANGKTPEPEAPKEPARSGGGLLSRFNRGADNNDVAPASSARARKTGAAVMEDEPEDAAPPPPKPLKPRKQALKLGRANGASDEADVDEAPPAPQPVAPAPSASPDVPTEGFRIIASEQTRKAAVPLVEKKGDYVFPPMNLLAEPEPVAEGDDALTHQRIAEQLVQTLSEFGVRVTMGEVHTGPVITRYDVYPAAGVRVEKIQNLDKNLALALKALSVRILAPVPGKGCVGIEIPNKRPQSVCIRDILESENWVNSKAEIPIALGKEVSGRPLVADLTKMPHLLIAGSTGSGKTVCINAVITSLLYKLSPEDVRFVMVDPKIVEMQVYNALPHMLIPVVTDPKKVPGALKYLLNEMERRYHMFAREGVRNIAGYNAKRSRDKDAQAKADAMDRELSPEERAAAAEAASISVPRDLGVEDDLPEKLPYIVAVVDELADLMMVAPADIETGIARLAQLARAAGIHLILATQRPSVNVITGVIKANLPSRIAFKVASKVDSRTILDTGGADQLIGRGDMLFLPPGSADLVRSQGAFVSDEEINGIVEFVSKTNGEPVFDELFQKSVEESIGEDGMDGDSDEDDDSGDALIPDALEVIRSTKRASTSMLQRRLRIGYNRAARIMEILEERGYVGPENGSQPREILRDLD